jgi:hypothetical protein
MVLPIVCVLLLTGSGINAVLGGPPVRCAFYQEPILA